jgi:hypothetical protein
MPTVVPGVPTPTLSMPTVVPGVPTPTLSMPTVVPGVPTLSPAAPTLTPGAPTLTPTVIRGIWTLVAGVPTLEPATATLMPGGVVAGSAVAASAIAPLALVRMADPLSWAEGQAPSLASVESTGVRSRSSHAGHKKRRLPVPGPVNGQPAQVLMTLSGAGAGAGSFASGGSGLFFFAVAGLLAWFALGVPRLSCRLCLIKELGTAAPFVLVLDRPG